ncbi:MAG: DAK2 domain-containing protein [Thermoflavifilum sp.]|nr:DAK2 domain-containing protein [Thermoflavifilum sp.]MCL6513321.1 DAK2 domain-containing protein [Alicyclobacillus sp.]
MTGLERLDGAAFKALVVSGHARLRAMAEAVNALNVFPVPDGDTGTNMELSLRSGVERMTAYGGDDLAGLAQQLATGLLMGARGNSGVILSQLFRGFVRVCRDADALDTRRFASALQEGVDIAYRAVAKPVEGTMLTVAREAAQTAVKAARKERDLQRWMNLVLEAARQALARTPEQLPVLRQAGVVDSGGQGLVYVYEGFLAFLEGRVESAPVQATGEAADVVEQQFEYAAARIDHEGEYGYCTEVLVDVGGHAFEAAEAALRERLASYGDSLLVVGVAPLIKVHVHTLHPGRVLEDALSLGELVKVKVDNMTRQHAEIRETHPAASAPSEPPDTDERAIHSSPEVSPRVRCGVVAVAAGDGLANILRSLGVQRIVSGGQTMNPSTEELVQAIRETPAEQVIILPNNKNVVLAAEQAAGVVGDHVRVVPSTSIPQAIAALLAYRPDAEAGVNAERMAEAMAHVRWGQVVQAARDTTYQGQEIRAGQFLGFSGPDLVEVGENREDVLVATVRRVSDGDAELVTVFYGAGVDEATLAAVSERITRDLGLEVEARDGGQPVYDYIFSVE